MECRLPAAYTGASGGNSDNFKENRVSALYDLQMTSITGEEITFAQFREQALLIVNLASQ